MTQHTHEVAPVILYLFHQAVMVVEDLAFEEKRYCGDFIEWSSDVRQKEGSHKILPPSPKLS